MPEDGVDRRGDRPGRLRSGEARPAAPLGRQATLGTIVAALALAGLGEAQLARHSIVPGLTLFGVAIPLFAAAILRGRGCREEELSGDRMALRLPPATLLPGRRGQLGLGLCATALLASVASLLLFARDPARSAAAWPPYLASLLLFVLGILASTEGNGGARRVPASELYALGGIVLLALLLRAAHLGTLPAGIWYDEAYIGIEARQILRDPSTLPVYAISLHQIAHHLFIFACSLHLFGDTIFGLRMASVLFGVGGVLAAYLCGREWRGGRLGLILAFVVATMRWHVNFTRIAMNGVDAPFFEFLALYFALRLLRGRASVLRSAAGLGLSLGLGLCFYSPTRLFVAALGLFVAGWWLIGRLRRFVLERRGSAPRRSARQTGAWLCLAAVVVAAWLAVMPTVQYAIGEPSAFWARTSQTSLFAKAGDADPVKLLAANVEKHLLMFNCCGDRNGRHNLPGAPTLDHVSGALLLLGIGLAMAQRDPAGRFFLLLLPVGLLGGILSLHFEAPQSLRSIGALPAVAAFVALSLDALWCELRSGPAGDRAPWKASPVAAVLAAIAAINTYVYFGQQMSDAQVQAEFLADETAVARRMVELGSELTYYFDYEYAGSRAIAFEAAGVTGRQETIYLLDPLPVREPADGPVAYFVSAEHQWIVEELRRLYPQAAVEQLPADPDCPPDTYLALLRPDDLASLQGLDLEYRPGDSWPPAGEPTPVVRVATVDALWPGDAAVEPPFVAVWSGVLYAPVYGVYELRAKAPGRVALTVDGETCQGEAIVTASSLLAEGNHLLRLAAQSGQGGVRLSWQGPGDASGTIPQWALYAEPVTVNGLLGRYYADDNWEGTPALERVDAVLDAYFHITPMPRPYSVEWTGVLVAPESGRYGLGLSSKDDSSLYVDGALMVSSPSAGDYVGGWVDLEAGPHSLRLAYRDLTGYSRIHLYWTPPGGAREILPSEYLWPGEWAIATEE